MEAKGILASAGRGQDPDELQSNSIKLQSNKLPSNYNYRCTNIVKACMIVHYHAVPFINTVMPVCYLFLSLTVFFFKTLTH